ncbi:MAG: threonine synthase [Alkaliphilus sp.]|nr:threonine synthase [Alkaliphilus sp. AH-315-G20]MBN4067622.1 threonine synthase [Alkaliphilus transvaalensis]PHS34870.1 MAG: threonine synthase [Alkaliphilus sp.]
MKYFSSRSKLQKIDASEAILKGLSDDGGLFVPEKFPVIDIEPLMEYSYNKMAYEIFKLYLADFNQVKLKQIIEQAYGNKFTVDNKVCVIEVNDKFILELFHGATLAFKDIALSVLPYFVLEAKRIQGIDEETVILVATSGDTGKAALEGFANVKDIIIIVFYPEHSVSEIQRLQMITQTGDNTHVVAIKGNFDDAQRAVKEAFTNKKLKQLLKSNKLSLSSANSINIGRLIPQIVYFFFGYMEMVRNTRIALGDEINIVVPTGNFGNILAAYYAKKMGLPVNKLICASNENNILTDFINTGIYDTNRAFVKTISPSMDILISSNLERFIFEIIDRDEDMMNKLMSELYETGKFILDKKYLNQIQTIMEGDFASERETKLVIKNCYTEHNYLLDPHTAVAYKVAEKYTKNTLIVSTASPYKFGDSILESFGENVKVMSLDEINDKIQKISRRKVPKSLEQIEKKEIFHKTRCEIEGIERTIKEILKVGANDD